MYSGNESFVSWLSLKKEWVPSCRRHTASVSFPHQCVSVLICYGTGIGDASDPYTLPCTGGLQLVTIAGQQQSQTTYESVVACSAECDNNMTCPVSRSNHGLIRGVDNGSPAQPKCNLFCLPVQDSGSDSDAIATAWLCVSVQSGGWCSLACTDDDSSESCPAGQSCFEGVVCGQQLPGPTDGSHAAVSLALSLPVVLVAIAYTASFAWRCRSSRNRGSAKSVGCFERLVEVAVPLLVVQVVVFVMVSFCLVIAVGVSTSQSTCIPAVWGCTLALMVGLVGVPILSFLMQALCGCCTGQSDDEASRSLLDTSATDKTNGLAFYLAFQIITGAGYLGVLEPAFLSNCLDLTLSRLELSLVGTAMLGLILLYQLFLAAVIAVFLLICHECSRKR